MSSLSRELVFLILQFLDEEKFKETVHKWGLLLLIIIYYYFLFLVFADYMPESVSLIAFWNQ